MSVPAVHFKSIRSDRYIVVRPLCEPAGVVCRDDNASPLRHEVTCKLCLKRMMAFAKWHAETQVIKADIAREQA